MIKKFSILILFLLIIALFLLPATNYQLPTTAFAVQQVCTPQTENPRAGGLISASDPVSGKFSSATGVCVVDDDLAEFRTRYIPTYGELKSLYFYQSKLPPTQKIPLSGSVTQTTGTSQIDLSE